VCGCVGSYVGFDCSLNPALPPVIDPSSTQQVCTGSCPSVKIIGSNFIDGAMCKFFSITVSLSFTQTLRFINNVVVDDIITSFMCVGMNLYLHAGIHAYSPTCTYNHGNHFTKIKSS